MSLKSAFFISILTSTLIASCSVSKDQVQLDKEVALSKSELNLVDSEIKSWQGALKGSEGYELKFTFVGKKLEEVVADSVWFDEHAGFRPNYNVKNDTLRVYGAYSEANKVLINDIDSGTSKSANVEVSPPIKYQGEALIRFYYNGEEKYFVIDKLNE